MAGKSHPRRFFICRAFHCLSKSTNEPEAANAPRNSLSSYGYRATRHIQKIEERLAQHSRSAALPCRPHRHLAKLPVRTVREILWDFGHPLTPFALFPCCRPPPKFTNKKPLWSRSAARDRLLPIRKGKFRPRHARRCPGSCLSSRHGFSRAKKMPFVKFHFAQLRRASLSNVQAPSLRHRTILASDFFVHAHNALAAKILIFHRCVPFAEITTPCIITSRFS